MNERIKELADQAFDTAEYPEDQRYRIEPNSAFCKKFAELIVKECANIFETSYQDPRIQQNFDKSIISLLKVFGKGHADFIREHFGVEQ